MTEAIPHIVEGSGDLAAYLGGHRGEVEAHLSGDGAVLLRGFDVPDAEAFDSVVRAWGEPNFAYAESLSNAVRVNVTERVFTANEAPPSTSIYLHHEMAQTPIYPSRLFFYCEIAPDSGGATPLCRSDDLLAELERREPTLVASFASRGVRYTNVMPGADDAGSGQGRSWRSTLGVGEREQAERRLAELGYQWEWGADDTLRATSPVLPAIRDLADGRRSFFNQLIAAFRGWSDTRNEASRSIRFGDGQPIGGEDMATAIAISEDLTVDLAWRQGDVALIDNFRVMHGRRPFEGRRRVLASLIA